MILFLGIPDHIIPLVQGAWNRTQAAYRPCTRTAHISHFKTFLAFCIHMKLSTEICLPNILAFLEFLASNAISPKVIQNYISSLRTMATKFDLPTSDLSHYTVFNFIRSLRINSPCRPTPRGIFTFQHLEQISKLCNSTGDPHLFRAAFLLAFFAFLRMSNVAPHARSAFSPSRHLLRQNIMFEYPGAKVALK